MAALVAASPAGNGAIRRAPVSDTEIATLEGPNEIFLEVIAGPRDSYVSLAIRYAGTEREWARIERANDGRRVMGGLFYSIPFEVLAPDHRARTIAVLFPDDGPGEGGWIHHVHEDGRSLESIALWFAGDASLADDLAESNGIAWAPLKAGNRILVPSGILAPEITALMATLPQVEPAPEVAARAEKTEREVAVGDLTFLPPEKGGHAVYKLRRGEALYSAVVARFTGQLEPKEVGETAGRIAELSGIKSMRSIPIGHPIVIPRDLILPEFLPPGDPLRAEHESRLAAAKKHRLTTRVRDLDGITLILDAGHGGDDVGAQPNGLHEDDYVYDIMCRIKRLAERTTGARVMTTIRDKSSGYKPLSGPFRIDKDEYLLTDPPYYPRKPHAGTAGVNLRWYLVNSYYRSLIRGGASPQKVLFVSIHADSLHPSVRGAMVYVPGQAYRRRTYGHTGKLYNRREVKELRYVKFSRSERERAEGLSRKLADQMITTFRKAGLPIHTYEPVRDHVIRRGRRWTPAVIRTSQVPQSILLEVINLNNKKDAALIKDPEFRQKVAEAFLDAVRAHYAGSGGASTSSTTARR